MAVEGGEEKFLVRKLQISDKAKGFIELLQQLSVCDSISGEEFEARFLDLSSEGEDHVICVIEDDRSGKIMATGSVFVEKKFLRNCGKVGHIEDVVVDSNARGMKLGQKIVMFLTNHARSVGCYKQPAHIATLGKPTTGNFRSGQPMSLCQHFTSAAMRTAEGNGAKIKYNCFSPLPIVFVPRAIKNP